MRQQTSDPLAYMEWVPVYFYPLLGGRGVPYRQRVLLFFIHGPSRVTVTTPLEIAFLTRNLGWGGKGGGKKTKSYAAENRWRGSGRSKSLPEGLRGAIRIADGATVGSH